MNHFMSLRYVFSPNKPWLILGKGPTLKNYIRYDLNNYNVLGLNHVVNYGIKVDVSLCIDSDVCTLDFIHNNQYILMPYHAHVKFKPSKYIGGDFISSKIFFFDCSTWKGKPLSKPIIQAKYNCAEAAFNILRWWQVKNILSLGIDGGKTYASFIKEKPLTNGQVSFDKQLTELRNICKEGNIKWTLL